MHLARANARLALDMAIGDLQEFTGPDRITAATAWLGPEREPISMTVSMMRPIPRDERGLSAFLDRVWNNDSSDDNHMWLVTRPLDATYARNVLLETPDPFASDYGAGKPLVIPNWLGAESRQPENQGQGRMSTIFMCLKSLRL